MTKGNIARTQEKFQFVRQKKNPFEIFVNQNGYGEENAEL
jgi:hypothetical protein